MHLSSRCEDHLLPKLRIRTPLPLVDGDLHASRSILDAKKRFTICAGGPLRGPRVHGREAVTRPSPAVFDDGRRRERASPHQNCQSDGVALWRNPVESRA
jgi:hypothetical protein